MTRTEPEGPLVVPASGLLDAPVEGSPSAVLPDELTRLAASGAVVLGARQVLATLVTLAGGVWLARVLSPADFGYYAAALLVLSISTTVGEGGVAASLVRESQDPSDAELRTAFTFQLLVTGVIAVAGSTLLPPLLGAAGVAHVGTRVISIALLTPVLASFKSVPTVHLERSMRFGPIGLASSAEVITFNVVAVVLAELGVGVPSLGYALVAAAAVGSIGLMVASPWVPRLGLRGDLGRHLRFGIPYQGVAAISVAKDSISPLLIGFVAGAAGVGYVEWSQRFAAYALLAVYILQRLLMSWFARVQHDQERLDAAVRLALQGTYAVVAPVAVLSLVLAEPITVHVFGEKWLPGLTVFWWLWAANLVVPAANVAMAGLNALGHSRVAFGFALLWMTLTWAFGLPLISLWGIVGYGVANVLVQFSNLWLFSTARRHFALPWISAAVQPWCASLVSAVPALLVWAAGSDPGLGRLVLAAVTFGVVYLLLLLGRRDVRSLAGKALNRGRAQA